MTTQFPTSLFRLVLSALLLCSATATFAQNSRVSGTVTDTAGAAIADATVDLINLASNAIRAARVDAAGKYEFAGLAEGQYRLVIKAPGYNDNGRTITVESAPLTEHVELAVGSIKEVITVTADRSLKADADIPLNVSVETAQSLEEKLPVSPGEALKNTPSLFVFNPNSPLSSPNLRGLQASRVLLVVDGERVNNSRTEIQTFGSSLGSYIDTFNIESAEVVAGAGSSLYGTDSLTGTINFTTKEPLRPDQGWVFGAKTGGLYSSNETGRKGNVTLNLSNPKFAVNLSGTLFRFDNYRMGDPGNGADVGLAAVRKQQDELKYLSNSNTSRQDFSLTDGYASAFGLGTPTNFDRQDVPNSLNHGAYGFYNLWLHPADKHSIRYKQQNNRLGYYGFPNQAAPYWHDLQFTSFERNDKYGVRYNGVELSGVLRRLAGGYYRQKLVRPIDNISLVTPAVRPPCIRGLFESAANCTAANQAINQTITRPSTLTFNKQAVTTNGADVQATLQLVPKNNLIVGYQFWRDKSADEFNSSVYNAVPGTPGRTVPRFSPFAGYTLNPAIPVIDGKGTADSYNQERAFFLA